MNKLSSFTARFSGDPGTIIVDLPHMICDPKLSMFLFCAGSGRYIPGSGPAPGMTTGVADPFTGSYLTFQFCCSLPPQHSHSSLTSAGGGAYSSAALQKMSTNNYFPKTDSLTFEQANTAQIFCNPLIAPVLRVASWRDVV